MKPNTSVANLIPKYGLHDHAAAILSLVRPCIRLARTPAESVQPHESRLGGTPHLPPGTEWPTGPSGPMTLIAQINCADAAPHDPTGTLPTSGMLWFWYDVEAGLWGFDPKDRAGFRVQYAAIVDELEVREAPQPPADRVSDLPDEGFYPLRRITFEPMDTLPNWEWLDSYVPEYAWLAEDARYEELRQALRSSKHPAHRLLGHPIPEQGPMERECQLASSGVNCGGGVIEVSEIEAAHHEKRASGWRLLLQVDTDNEDNGPGWMWGDVGMLYFWIHEEALRRRAFDECWQILQCG